MRSSRAVLLALFCVACPSKVPEPEGRSVLLDPVASAAPSASSPEQATAATHDAPPGTGQQTVTDIENAARKHLKKEDSKVGTGPAAKSGDTVRVHYTGKLLDGTKFDSSRDRDEPFEFTLGKSMVIKGWDEGIVGMKKGGLRKLTIPPALGYGSSGSPPAIPPDAVLVFDVELIEIR